MKTIRVKTCFNNIIIRYIVFFTVQVAYSYAMSDGHFHQEH